MLVTEKTLEIASYVKVEAWGPYENVHFLDTGKFFGSREEYNKYLAGVEKKEAAKRDKERAKIASEKALDETYQANDTDVADTEAEDDEEEIEELEEEEEDLDSDEPMQDE